jgi:hypothetical protein
MSVLSAALLSGAARLALGSQDGRADQQDYQHWKKAKHDRPAFSLSKAHPI